MSDNFLKKIITGTARLRNSVLCTSYKFFVQIGTVSLAGPTPGAFVKGIIVADFWKELRNRNDRNKTVMRIGSFINRLLYKFMLLPRILKIGLRVMLSAAR